MVRLKVYSFIINERSRDNLWDRAATAVFNTGQDMTITNSVFLRPGQV